MDNGHKRACDLIIKDEGNEKRIIINEEKLKYLINFNSHRSVGIDEEEKKLCDRRATFGRADEIVCSNCGSESGGGGTRQHFSELHLDNKRTSECRVNCPLLIERLRYNKNNLNRYKFEAVNNSGVMMKNKQQQCGGDDARTVAMETDVNGSSCDATAAPNGNNCRLMTNENVVDHLKGMSLSDRRASVTPRITLTNVEDDPKQQQQAFRLHHEQGEEDMITDEDQCSSPLSPRFLSVPKIEELGPERRPPQMVKTM